MELDTETFTVTLEQLLTSIINCTELPSVIQLDRFVSRSILENVDSTGQFYVIRLKE
jgi:hypothetical protein